MGAGHSTAASCFLFPLVMLGGNLGYFLIRPKSASVQGDTAVPSAQRGSARLLQHCAPQAQALGKAVAQREMGSPNMK